MRQRCERRPAGIDAVGGRAAEARARDCLHTPFRFLLIDEMVRRINADGTAVVVVEQSVNVALSVVDHAYFMEKGEFRFDDRATHLLARPDLLRSVFLQGASHGLSGSADRS